MLTGLPVYVNGFFALSSNRHHLKWDTDEDKKQQQKRQNVIMAGVALLIIGAFALFGISNRAGAYNERFDLDPIY